MKNAEVVRLNTNVPTSLMKKLDSYAAELNINRTAALAVVLSTFFRQEEAQKNISEVLAKMPK